MDIAHFFSSGKKKVAFDMCLNIIAVSLPVAMLQLIIYPHTAKIIGGEEYGLMLTIYSVWIMISNSLGNVLNNIKLLRYPEYNKLGEEGDIPVLLRLWIAASSVIVFAVIWFYCGHFSFVHIVFGTIISVCILMKAYLEVGFRIELNYVAIVCNNALLSAGFLIGYFLFLITNVWEFIFLIGYMFSCCFCAFKTKLLHEAYRKTAIYGSVKKDAYSLVLATIISNLINYADKLILYPLMGGTAVSIYYTATILGKITGMLTGPINSVILSYITRWDNSRANYFTKVLLLGIILSVCGYLATILLGRPVIGLLFPQWVDEVMIYLPVTTITVMLTVLVSFLQPFVLKYCELHWQIVISGIGSAVYFIGALLLWSRFELMGFCVGTVIGASVKLAIMIGVYYHSIKKEARES